MWVTPSQPSRRARSVTNSGAVRSRGRGSSTVTSWAMRPSSITRTRSASSSASSTSCVTRRIAQPCRSHSSATSCCTLPRVSASSAPNGSSRSRSSGSRTRARASETRWAWPPESVLGQTVARSAMPTSSSALSASARSGRPGSPRTTLRHTFSQGSSRGDWNAALRRAGTVTSPPISSSSPARMRSRVDLPQPLWPSRATNSPSRMSRSSSCSTVLPSKARDSPRISTLFGTAVVTSGGHGVRGHGHASPSKEARQLNRRRERTRTAKSQARPSSAYTARHSTMTSVRKYCWALLIR